MVADGQLNIDLDGGVDERWLQCADVLHATALRPYGEALRLARRTMRRRPGCLLTVVRCTEGGCVAAARAGDRVVVRWLPVGAAFSTEGYVRFSSLLYVWLVRARTAGPATGRTAGQDGPGAPPGAVRRSR
ncbi:hypothetical protein HY68_04180 [Streptomyces sp. AcH 505]|nr:hypothetical protein HY68_04180 [Streptomyces sp. AcH 505]